HREGPYRLDRRFRRLARRCQPARPLPGCVIHSLRREFPCGRSRLFQMMRILAVLLTVAALGACTPMRWEHPQYGLAGAQEDLATCNQSARAEAWQYQSSVRAQMWEPARYYRNSSGRFVYDPWSNYRRYDPWMDESRLANFCMRNKGYQLVPVP